MLKHETFKLQVTAREINNITHPFDCTQGRLNKYLLLNMEEAVVHENHLYPFIENLFHNSAIQPLLITK